MKKGTRMNQKRRSTTARNLLERFEDGKPVLDYFNLDRGIHPNWGGARKGAGRKTEGRVRLQLLLPPEVSERIRERARSEGKSLSDTVAACF